MPTRLRQMATENSQGFPDGVPERLASLVCIRTATAEVGVISPVNR
jgi:hypothetical protein